ncbi:MAG: dTDP-glucose 4,6-dehydratase [Planctomycetota bacterium]|jgi:dTDP-glucose 4,6-dehydratase
MKILVTGGAGFIGSNFIRYILDEDKNATIVNLDLLTYAGNLANLKDVENNERYQFLKGDITDYDIVDKVLSADQFDLLINFAAESHVDRSIYDSRVFVQTNILGTQVLLDSAKRNAVKRFCQVSTDEVYGSLNDSDPAFTEDNPITPSSPYSASKAGADHLCLSYCHTHKLDVVITRCSNNYGPYQFPEKFIPLFITNAMENKKLPLYGDGRNVRDWIHVLDHAAGVWKACLKGNPGEVYNFGGGNEYSNIDITKMILNELECDDNLIELVKDRPGHDWRYAMDYSKAQAELGWKPEYVFSKGLSETITWYKDNCAWWESIKSGEYMKYYDKHYGKKGC